MLFLHLGKDQDVIQIDYHNAFYYEVLEDVIHHDLESGQTVSHPEKYYQGFKQVLIGLEGCLSLISRLNMNIIETPMDVVRGSLIGNH